MTFHRLTAWKTQRWSHWITGWKEKNPKIFKSSAKTGLWLCCLGVFQCFISSNHIKRLTNKYSILDQEAMGFHWHLTPPMNVEKWCVYCLSSSHGLQNWVPNLKGATVSKWQLETCLPLRISNRCPCFSISCWFMLISNFNAWSQWEKNFKQKKKQLPTQPTHGKRVPPPFASTFGWQQALLGREGPKFFLSQGMKESHSQKKINWKLANSSKVPGPKSDNVMKKIYKKSFFSYNCE